MSIDPQLRNLNIDLPACPQTLVRLSLLMADEHSSIDQLAALQSQHGQEAAEQAMQHTAAHLAQRIRRSDSLGHHGAHTFLLLLPNTPTPGARQVLHALRESMLDAPAPADGADVLPVSISVGLWCGVPNLRDEPDELIARARGALQAAQEAGTNHLRVAT